MIDHNNVDLQDLCQRALATAYERAKKEIQEMLENLNLDPGTKLFIIARAWNFVKRGDPEFMEPDEVVRICMEEDYFYRYLDADHEVELIQMGVVEYSS